MFHLLTSSRLYSLLFLLLPVLCLALTSRLLFLVSPAEADELVTDLSTSQVTIQTDFTGETILLFGAINIKNQQQHQLDVVVIIRGPDQALTILRKSRNFGIWVNRDALQLESVPAYYAVAASRQLTEIAAPQELSAYRAGLAYLPTSHEVGQTAQHDTPQTRAFIDGLIRNKKTRGLYSEVTNGVRIIGERLFRAEIALPPGVPVGNYQVDILLFRDGKVVSKQSNTLTVDIRGIEQLLYVLAQHLPAFYGLAGVVISIISGWGAAILFRRRA